jgi:hypothetical protein
VKRFYLGVSGAIRILGVFSIPIRWTVVDRPVDQVPNAARIFLLGLAGTPVHPGVSVFAEIR